MKCLDQPSSLNAIALPRPSHVYMLSIDLNYVIMLQTNHPITITELSALRL